MIGQSDQQNAPRLRLSLRQLEVFAAIAHSGSTRVGAGRVARSQSAASAALAELETALGEALFDRIGRRLVLNENGRALLPSPVALLGQAAELQGRFSGEHAAPLRVAASLTIGEYLLPGLMAQWKLAHPHSAVATHWRRRGPRGPVRANWPKRRGCCASTAPARARPATAG